MLLVSWPPNLIGSRGPDPFINVEADGVHAYELSGLLTRANHYGETVSWTIKLAIKGVALGAL